MLDVIVIGGGPGGSTAASLLARRGFSVALLEKEKFPRFQIGESLLPYNNDIFRELGLLPKLEQMRHFPKYGAEFITGDGKVGYTFRFRTSLPQQYGRSFQVTRSRFDQLLLESAREAGVDVREETTVLDADLSRDDGVTVRTRRDGVESVIEARFVVDASGHGAVLGQKVGEKSENAGLRKIAIFAHYSGVAPSGPGDDAGNTVIAVIRNGWFWLIPLSDETTSIGVVVDRDEFRASGLAPETFLARILESTPYVQARMRASQRVSQVYARKDFSYRMGRMTGPNFALVGDAAGFIDPIFSTGVFMAMKSSALATDAIETRLRSGSIGPLEAYQQRVNRSLDRYLAFIEHFYRREFLEVFLQPAEIAKRLGLLRPILGMLAGDVFERRSSRWGIALFFFLVRMQKRFGVIAPAIPWQALPAPPRGRA